MPKNWIISIPRADMERCVSIGKYGMSRPFRITDVKIGDNIIAYVSKEAKIIATGKVSKSYYKGTERIFLAPGSFEHRIDFRSKRVDPEFDFRSITSELQLTKDLRSWGAVFRAGIISISDSDYALILRKLQGELPKSDIVINDE